jgi:hypothetical protein
VREVIWAGSTAIDDDGEVDLDLLTALHARARLVSRLVELDGPAGASFSFLFPYADLTDRQLADLVLDMDLPLWTCWWWGPGRGPRGAAGADLARMQYERWDRLLKEAGWMHGMPGPATIEGTEEPSRRPVAP